MMYVLQLKYVYTFYSFGEELFGDVIEEEKKVGERFTLYHQEDASFVVSEVKEDFRGKYVILTYPNKDNVVVYENDVVEIAYDEYYSAMGDDNHNVYEGTVTLIKRP